MRQKFGPDGYSLLHRATWRPGEAAVDALVYLLDFLDVDTRAVRRFVAAVEVIDIQLKSAAAAVRVRGMCLRTQVAAVPERKKKNKSKGTRQAAAIGSTPLMEAASRGQVLECPDR